MREPQQPQEPQARSWRLDKPSESKMTKSDDLATVDFSPDAYEKVFSRGPEARKDFVLAALSRRKHENLMSKNEELAVLEIMLHVDPQHVGRTLWRLFDPDYKGRYWGQSENVQWVWQSPPFRGLADVIVHQAWYSRLLSGDIRSTTPGVTADDIIEVGRRLAGWGVHGKEFHRYCLDMFAMGGLEYYGEY